MCLLDTIQTTLKFIYKYEHLEAEKYTHELRYYLLSSKYSLKHLTTILQVFCCDQSSKNHLVVLSVLNLNKRLLFVKELNFLIPFLKLILQNGHQLLGSVKSNIPSTEQVY